MIRFKDILYDKSDIVLALVILLIAGALIWNRIGAIMTFSATEDVTDKAVASESKDPTQEEGSANSDETATDEEENSDESDDQTTEKGETVRVIIGNDDVSTTIADKLVEAGLIESANDFLKAVKEEDAETDLRSGRFDIEMGSTPKEIVTLLTTTYGV